MVAIPFAVSVVILVVSALWNILSLPITRSWKAFRNGIVAGLVVAIVAAPVIAFAEGEKGVSHTVGVTVETNRIGLTVCASAGHRSTCTTEIFEMGN